MITDNYIKMCDQAEEIQELWNPKEYDIFTYDGTSLFRYPLVRRTKKWMIKHKPIWLPTQEQLWDMLEGTILEKLDNFMDNLTINVYETLQEHILNHVMEHNWGKVWFNKKWEVI